MAFGVIIVGDEILSGRRSDKHLAKAIELLGARGLRLAWARYCGDEPPRLIGLLRESFASGDIVFSFGGIGATPDDHTRQCAAAALGVSTVLHPDAEREIRARLGSETTPQRLMMGEFPEGSEIIPNPYNRIPGFRIREHHFLPGFPQMAWPMMEWALDTYYRHLHHAEIWVEEAITVFDAMEGQLIDLMTALEARHEVTVFSLPTLAGADGRRQIELGAKASSSQAVAAAMRDMKMEIDRLRYEWAPVIPAPKPGA